MAKGRMRIDYVALDEVAGWPRNPKLHDLNAIGASVERFGFVSPIILDEGTGQLVAGHGRLETLQRLKGSGVPPPPRVRKGRNGDWQVPVVRGIEFASPEEAEAYLIADNRLTELGGWDAGILTDMLADADPADLASVGFDRAELDRLASLAQEGPKERLVQFTAREKEPVERTCPECGHRWTEEE